MNLYVVNLNNDLAKWLLERDIPYQVVTDPHKTGKIACKNPRGCVVCYCDRKFKENEILTCLRVWCKDGDGDAIYPLIQVGVTWKVGKGYCFLCAPIRMREELSVPELYEKMIGG